MLTDRELLNWSKAELWSGWHKGAKECEEKEKDGKWKSRKCKHSTIRNSKSKHPIDWWFCLSNSNLCGKCIYVLLEVKEKKGSVCGRVSNWWVFIAKLKIEDSTFLAKVSLPIVFPVFHVVQSHCHISKLKANNIHIEDSFLEKDSVLFSEFYKIIIKITEL